MEKAIIQTGLTPPAVPKRKLLLTYGTMTNEQRDCENWPRTTKPDAAYFKAAHSLLSDAKAEEFALLVGERFDRLSKAIRAYLADGKLKPALEIAECGRDSFYEQLNRCLAQRRHGDGIVGWAGLIYHLRLSPTRGKFRKWLDENRAWREILHELIQCGGGNRKVKLRKPNAETVTRAFTKAFRTGELPGSKDGLTPIPPGMYPNIGKSVSRSSIRNYITEYVATHLETTELWFGTAADAKKGLGTGKTSFLLPSVPFDVIGGDAHTVDAIGIIILPGPSGPLRVPVKRFQVFIDTCQNSRAITGYSVCIASQIEARQVEQAHLMATKPWQPMNLTVEGLTYAPGAGFPCGSIAGLGAIQPSMKRLDNASQHWAVMIREDLRAAIGCAIAWGGVGHWWRNAISERLFGTLERYGFQRLPSSMGNGTQDPHRADNPALEAKGVGIEWHELVQVLDVLLANYNATPHSALGGLSPLDHIRQSLNSRLPRWIPRIAPPPTATSPRLGWTVLRDKTICGSVRHRVTPYVEIFEERYTGDHLCKRYDLIGRKCVVHVPENMVSCELFLAGGERLGTLTVLHKGWANTPHTIQDRQAFNRLVRDGNNLDRADPIASLAAHYRSKALEKAAEAGTSTVSADASKLADLQRRTGLKTNQPALSSSPPDSDRTERMRQARGIKLPHGW